MKLRKKYLVYLLIILIGGYFGYRTIAKNKAQKEHLLYVQSLENTASENVHILSDTISIDYLGTKRTLALYLPNNYELDSVSYPVIYFLDGQSLFDQKIQEGTEWQIDEVLDSISNLGGRKSIVVGINSSEDRMKEYKPFPSDRWYSHKNVSGDQHAEWIVQTLKPWIDARYRTNPDMKSTIIGGASLGGLMSYYMLMEYPENFGGAIVFSPSFWVNEEVYTLHKKNKNLFKQRIYFDAGELETPTVDGIEKMRDILIRDGMPEENMKLDIESDEGHWHMTWRKGFKKAYPWILAKD